MKELKEIRECADLIIANANENTWYEAAAAKKIITQLDALEKDVITTILVKDIPDIGLEFIATDGEFCSYATLLETAVKGLESMQQQTAIKVIRGDDE